MENPIWSYIFKKTNKEEADLLEILRQIPIFDSLSRRELGFIKQLTHERTYNKGEVVFEEDEPGAGLYIIVEGKVRIFINDSQDNETVLANLEEGQFFGELSLLQDAPRSAAAVAEEPCVLLGFFNPDLMSIIDRNPKVGCKILLRLSEIIGERLIKTNEMLQNKN